MKNESKMKDVLKIRVYYFSATGNTKYGLLLLQKHLLSAGHTCELLSIESENTIKKDDCDLLGFACPVYGGYPTENMMDLIEKSACFDDIIPAFTVLCPCSSIGYWGSKELFADILKKKNIQVISELGFLGNPSHPTVVGSLEQSSPKIRAFFNGIGRPDSHDEREIKEFSEKMVRTFQDYSEGKKIKRLPHSSLKIWASTKINMKEKKFQIEHPIMLHKDKCIQCGFCQKTCPTKAIILNPYPERDFSKCFACQKCTNLCPQQAFYLKDIERTGHYKGSFEKIKKMNGVAIGDRNNVNEVQHKESFILKFLSTGLGMVVLTMIGKYTDRKIIKKGDAKSSVIQG